MDDEREQQKIVSEREREKRESESGAKKMENAGNNEKLKKFSVMRQYDGDDGGDAAVAAGRAAVAQNLYIDTQTKKNCKQFKLNDFELHNSGTFEFNLHFALMK